MRLYLVRHGETVENKALIVQGHMEGQLNAMGKEQAGLLAERLRIHSFKHIYSSDLSRAFDTASEIANYHPQTPFSTRQDLREMYLGYLQGRRRSDLHTGEAIKQNPCESKESLRARVNGFLKHFQKKHPIDQILVVAHGGTNRMIYEQIMGSPNPGKLHNTGLSIFEMGNGPNQLHLYNCIKHLQ